MLALMRHAARSPIAVVIIGLLIASFALWGISDIFTRGGNAVAIVGSETITAQELNQAYETEFSRIQRENPQLTREMADQYGLGEQVLQRLIGEAALRVKANTMNLAVSDDKLLETIQDIEAFKSPFSGQFDSTTYASVLRDINLNTRLFERQVREELRRGQISTAVYKGVSVPEIMLQAQAAFAGERRQIHALMLSPSLAGDIEAPTDEQLTTFIEENAQYFTRPEQRRFTLVRFEPSAFAPDIEVSEDDIRARYDYERESGSLGTPATRSLITLAAGTQETAQALAARLREGASADALAQEFSLLEPQTYDSVQAYQIPDSTIAAAAFEMQTNEVRAIEGRLGWTVIQVSAAQNAVIPTYETQSATIRQSLAEAQAGDVMYDRVSAFQDAVAQGSTLEEAAIAANVPYESFDFITNNGFTLDQEPVYTLLEASDLLEQIFALPLAYTSDVEGYGEGNYFVARVDAIEDQRLATLDEVRDEVTPAWRARQLDEALGVIVAQAQTRINAGEDLNVIADSLGAGARVETATLTREQTAGAFNQRLVSQAFNANAHEAFEARAGDGRTRALVLVDAILPPANASMATVNREAMEQGLTQDIAIRFENALRNHYEPKVDTNLRDLALGRTQPTQ
ncbi:peptidylprolyl isomerase [Woodsholea maritima]|uniref:peptidylprolyl isomerase n=1 Tax=Woodsholea maritima TaxID=240237 RepID=UPI0003AA357C|nr:peptidylprolyl isomerase [Woodsholea maritima]